jgi:hypothetical protein
MITPEDARVKARAIVERKVWDLRVFIIGGGFAYNKMFYDAGFKGARFVEDADFLCFTGGEDVDPALYGEKALTGTYFNTARDEREAEIFGRAVGLQKPMVGICRGGQFLNVMNKGKMWQHVDNHALSGTHSIIDMKTGKEIDGMTSTHHQMMRPADDAEILAITGRSTIKQAASEEIRRDQPETDDMEVLWYNGTLSLCFQPHPEIREGQCRDYFMTLVDEYIIPAT